MAGNGDGKAIVRKRFLISGIVQGVGFRPFVFRSACELGLTGWVRNIPAGVEIEVQGTVDTLEAFQHSLTHDLPPLATVTSSFTEDIPPVPERGFTILPSGDGAKNIQVAPDSALCGDCLRELFDPADRRYRYPFITCTNCGPRYSIITAIPYDRPRTTMAEFPVCPNCRREYDDPADRRFHAQPIACPVCGPQLRLLDGNANPVAERDDALIQAIELLRGGKILAVKGIGGYHLAVDACNPEAVKRLRERKKRDEKPFAVMAADLATARKLVVLGDQEERLLTGPESPIVIAHKTPDCPVAPLVAPANGWLGLMLPYAPVHHLLMRDHFAALVMTSGNVSDEPVAFEDSDALKRLAAIADFFLVHNRPIHVRSDDSVLRLFQDKPLFYRRARGYAPRAVRLPFTVPPLLAVGAELKGAVCLAQGDQAFLSQHIGDLQNSSTADSFRHTIRHLSGILEIAPQLVACDLHPDYISSLHATESGLPLTRVQHHHAHMAACMAENGLEGEVVGIIFDGTGFGTDGTIWGGEFLVGGYEGFQRAGNFLPVPLAGGDTAVREPWRMALAWLYRSQGKGAFELDHPVARHLDDTQKGIFAAMLERGLNAPLTSSCGRLFDAAAALLNVRQTVSYDGQAAIELEALAEAAEVSGTYSFGITGNERLAIDFTPLFQDLLADTAAGTGAAAMAYRFHATVAQAAVETAVRIAGKTGLDRIVLSGGVFQNRLLSEMVYTELLDQGLQIFTHRLVPPNDGGIALGQAAIAGWQGRR
ncbi:carbamoyltransferase HypF [Oryzomonas japonica]|uniref:Carbamoyltransferase n=1 Tax=Oryzomonas japonica TaxID=2603858 RepID=A0A7J4ZSS1_9BACT|nr:carbamoyltransferase HypF [Oryzomonas japonica]KAB0666103.1 carbamoyltransferase HypF [Oryzomonas japonica]